MVRYLNNIIVIVLLNREMLFPLLYERITSLKFKFIIYMFKNVFLNILKIHIKIYL